VSLVSERSFYQFQGATFRMRKFWEPCMWRLAAAIISAGI
jgi:hypothetical protein